MDRACRSGTAWHGVRYDDASPTLTANHIFANARSGIYASGKTSAIIKDNLFTANETFINRPLAAVYNVPYASAEDWAPYTFPAASERSGRLRGRRRGPTSYSSSRTTGPFAACAGWGMRRSRRRRSTG